MENTEKVEKEKSFLLIGAPSVKILVTNVLPKFVSYVENI